MYNYADALIDKIEKYHAKQVEVCTSDKDAVSNPRAVKHEGLYVDMGVQQFIQALHPLGYKFAASDNCQCTYIGEGRYMFFAVEVYREGDEYSLGRIGCRETKKIGEYTYTVYSRKIENGKRRSNSEMHYTKTSTKLDAAVTNAKKFLRIHTPVEICYSTVGMANLHIQDVKVTASNKVSELRRNLLSRQDTEVLRILTTLAEGRTPDLPPVMREQLAEYKEQSAIYTRESSRQRPVYHINIHGTEDAQRATIIEIPDVLDTKVIRDTLTVEGKASVTTVNSFDIPEDIMGRLAVLNMNDVGHYVEGVGLKATTRSFWIEREGL